MRGKKEVRVKKQSILSLEHMNGTIVFMLKHNFSVQGKYKQSLYGTAVPGSLRPTWQCFLSSARLLPEVGGVGG